MDQALTTSWSMEQGGIVLVFDQCLDQTHQIESGSLQGVSTGDGRQGKDCFQQPILHPYVLHAFKTVWRGKVSSLPFFLNLIRN